ncbi:MAG: hypothetical protein R2856_07975 [Caldilineaceae bacterium]
MIDAPSAWPAIEAAKRRVAAVPGAMLAIVQLSSRLGHHDDAAQRLGDLAFFHGAVAGVGDTADVAQRRGQHIAQRHVAQGHRSGGVGEGDGVEDVAAVEGFGGGRLKMTRSSVATPPLIERPCDPRSTGARVWGR